MSWFQDEQSVDWFYYSSGFLYGVRWIVQCFTGYLNQLSQFVGPRWHWEPMISSPNMQRSWVKSHTSKSCELHVCSLNCALYLLRCFGYMLLLVWFCGVDSIQTCHRFLQNMMRDPSLLDHYIDIEKPDFSSYPHCCCLSSDNVRAP